MSPMALNTRQEPPPVVVPPGMNLNDNFAPTILITVGVFTGTALLSLILRIYVRIRYLKFMGVDDYFILVAGGISAVVCGFFVVEIEDGLGRHYPTLTLDDYQGLAYWMYFHSLAIVLGLVFTKISIAFFLLRLANHTKYKMFLWGTIGFIAVSGVVFTFTLMFQCVPIHMVWNFLLRPTAKCYSMETFTSLGLLNSAVNVITDVLLAVLPIPLILKLQINTRTKISLILVLSLGLFACISGLVKITKQKNVLAQVDWMYRSDFTVWNNMELNVGILAACLPCLKPLVASILQSARSASHTSNRNRTGYGTGYYKHEDSKCSVALRPIPGIAVEREGDEDKRQYVVAVTSTVRGDDESEEGGVAGGTVGRKDSDEMMLPTRPLPTAAGNGIHITTEVRVH